jgi:hypothetical protein
MRLLVGNMMKKTAVRWGGSELMSAVHDYSPETHSECQNF